MIIPSIRQATRAHHVALESIVDFKSRMITVQRYSGLLQIMHGIIAPLERELGRLDWSGTGIDFASRRKAHWLASDLDFLESISSEGRQIGQCEILPMVTNLNQAFGCLYVMEGSTLGGKIIGDMLTRQLGITRNSGGAFYASYGVQIPKMWEEFRDAATSFCNTTEKCDEAVDAAVKTFECYASWFKENTPGARDSDPDINSLVVKKYEVAS